MNQNNAKKRITVSLATHVGLILCSVIIAFPFFWMLSNSIKTKEEIWRMPPMLWPASAQWVNYADALKDGIFFRYLWNSTYTSLLLTLILLFNSAMFAYAITNIRFKGRNILFILVMITYIMPGASTHVPAYVILARMGLINSHMGYVVSCAASIFNIFFFRQTFMQINASIIEAAKVDGASHFQTLWRIIFPITTSAFVTLGILSFLGSYNSYIWPSLIIKDQSKYFISMGLKAFFTAEGAYGLKWGAIMAACCVVIFPLLLIFFIGQRWIINGISGDSAIKG